ncbi:uncharacterized protein [Montipora foliosa]|uniref:uncharacterized protein n=1 Tax=Montipora foliosa TaxID=591990 RepID=UPI0035F13DFC
MPLRRFIARRGKPTVIYSDNGTNFVGANRELRECIDDWNQDMIGGVLSQDGIQWVFNPPAAPHMGGLWERLVRSCKKALHVVLRNQVLTNEVLLTAFAEVEWLVNSRPLTEVSSDVDDLEALTANHFIIGRGTLNLPPIVFIDKEMSSHKRWRQAQVVATHIWNRWLREYLPRLITRKKLLQPTANVKIGDLVLVYDYAVPRGYWPLGRIVKVFPGHDNIVRSAEVKTKFGVMKRPYSEEKYNELVRKYKITAKGEAEVLEELERYELRIEEYRLNRLFQQDQKRVYQELNDEMTSEGTVPEVEHEQNAEWLKEVKGERTEIMQENLTITTGMVEQ